MTTRRHRNLMSAISLRWLTIYLSVVTLAAGDDDTDLPAPEVKTMYGHLRGTFYETENGQKVYAFLKVPYARPPIKKLRFEPPRRLPKWNGTIDATKEMPECLQMNHAKIAKGEEDFITGKEDCLYMNIYTKRIISTAEPIPEEFMPDKPVVVFIHGGGFSQGSGKRYKPKYIFDRMDVVFISINYRLGPFGFLSTESEVVPGNMGLKDQVLALKWIRETVHVFGGDKNKIRLVGVSAGAASVHFHYLSKLSRDLFSLGISMSGSAFSPWALMEKGRDKYRKLSLSLGCPYRDDRERMKCLRTHRGYTILREVKKLFMVWQFNPFSIFAPIVERENTSKSFLDEDPYHIIRKGNGKDAVWVASVTSNPGLYPGASFLANDELMFDLETNWEKYAPHLLDFNYTVPVKYHSLVSEAIKKQYGGSLNPHGLAGSFSPQSILGILSDRLYKTYMGMAAKLQAYHQARNVYFYEFGYSGKDSYTRLYARKGEVYPGVTAEDELVYAFGSPFRDIDKASDDYQVLEFKLSLWKNLFLDGVPDPESLGYWDPVEKDNRFGYLNALSISHANVQAMVHHIDFGNQHFWMTLNIDEVLFYKNYVSHSYHLHSSTD